jgi:hypothetical protein
MIRTAGPAVSNVTIKARLVLDERGRPIVLRSGRYNHYKIELWLEGVPEDAHAATWVLHDSYRDPVREVLDGPSFPLGVSTYGDYDVVANVRRRRYSEKFTARISEALRAGHPSPTPEIAAAIAEIRAN